MSVGGEISADPDCYFLSKQIKYAGSAGKPARLDSESNRLDRLNGRNPLHVAAPFRRYCGIIAYLLFQAPNISAVESIVIECALDLKLHGVKSINSELILEGTSVQTFGAEIVRAALIAD